jgi:hypothetical protein
MTSFQSILEEHNIEYRSAGQHEHTREGWIQIDCPWCGKGSRKFHLGINIDGVFANCWKCSYHSVQSVLFELIPGTSWGDAQSLLNDLDKAPRRPVEGIRPKGRLQTPSGVEPLSRLHKSYLMGRLFNPDELVKLWGIQGIRISSRLPWRIWIPIHYQGEIVSWTTRAIGAKVDKRYISASAGEEVIPHKNVLYGWDYVRHSVIICEGPIDVWRIGPGAVATFGLNFSDSQIELMRRIPRRVICFDNEKQAQKRAEALSSKLIGFHGETYIVRVESGGDVGEADKEEVETLRRIYLD